MHNGFIRIDDEKMSKSLNNFFTVRDVLQQYRAEEIRFFMLNSHYRSPLNYSTEQLDNARAALTRLYTALRDLPTATAPKDTSAAQNFHAAMQDDFNTAGAMAVLFDLARDINRLRQSDTHAAAAQGALLQQLAGHLGLLQHDANTWLKGDNSSGGLSDSDIEAKVQERLQARANKEWAASDRIRDELKAQGIVLEDRAGTTTWRRE